MTHRDDEMFHYSTRWNSSNYLVFKTTIIFNFELARTIIVHDLVNFGLKQLLSIEGNRSNIITFSVSAVVYYIYIK